MAKPDRRRSAGGTRIDWEGVRLGRGPGAFVFAMGALLPWAVLTAPPGEGPGAASRATDVTCQLAWMLPSSVKGRIAAGLGGLFMLGGVWMFALGCTMFLPGKRIPARNRRT
jgi:hypothetical protein